MVALISLPSPLPAAAPATINYQGKLSDSTTGAPLTTSVGMTFRVYDNLNNLLYTEVLPGVSVVNGVFTAGIGSATPIPASVFQDPDLPLSLEVVVGVTALTPRQPLWSAPYALAVAAGSVTNAEVASAAGIAMSKLEGTPDTAGTINTGTNPIDWTKLKNVPLGFADGVDNGGLLVRQGGTDVVTTSTMNFLSPPFTAANNAGTADVGLSASSVTLRGNSFNGANQLALLGGSGLVPNSVVDGSSVTKQGNAFNGNNQLVRLNASGALPALSGVNLTGLTAANISAGSLDVDVIASSVAVNAVGNMQISGVDWGKLGNVPAGFADGVDNAGAGAAGIQDGGATVVNSLSIMDFNGPQFVVPADGGSGTAAVSLSASSVTLQGNSFNGNNQLVRLNASGALPALSGVNLTGLTAGNISAGSLDVDVIASSVAVNAVGNMQISGVDWGKLGNVPAGFADGTDNTGAGASSVQDGGTTQVASMSVLNFNGPQFVVPADGGSGTADVSVSASSVTLQGNSFNGNNQLLRLSGSGLVPNAQVDVSSVTKQGNTFNGTNQLVRLVGDALTLGNSASSIVLRDSDNTNNAIIDAGNLTADRTFTLPDVTGTLATTGNLFTQGGNSFSAAATLGTNDGNPLIFETNTAERVRIDTAGNVGIGTNNPTASLMAQKSSGETVIRVATTDNTSGLHSGFDIYDPVIDNWWGRFVVNHGSKDQLEIWGSGWNNPAIVINNNRVGIGTNSPFDAALEVSNAGAGGGMPALVVPSGGGSVGIGTSTPAEALHVASAGGTVRFDGQQPALYLRETDQSLPAGLWRMHLTGDRFDIDKNSAAAGDFSSYFPVFRFEADRDTHLAVFGGNVGIDVSPAGTWKLEVNGNAANNTGVWAIRSDRRLKRDISPLRGALDIVSRLRGVEFRWSDPDKDGREGLQRGFIAQEVEAVVPEWVKKGADGYLYLEKGGAEAILVEAIKEQNALIREQKALLDELRKIVCEDHPKKSICQ